jgi:protein-disulfide isomerase
LSYGTGGESRLSKNEKREAAREKARVLREEHHKKERRSRLLLQGGIVLGLVGILALVAVVLVNSARPAGPGPLNMLSDGIKIGQGFVAEPTAALQPDADPVPNERDPDADVIDIRTYVDYLCPFCGDFEATNGEYIASLVENGGATLTVHPISILDRASQGNRYSSRAMNAAACVANDSPNQFFDFNALLFANQPAENSAGLSDDEIIAITVEAGVEEPEAVATCIRDEPFRAWVTASSARALNGPIPDANIEKVTGTPTVIVNGLKYEGPVDDLESFKAFVVQASGASFVEESSSTSTPTPTPTPAP